MGQTLSLVVGAFSLLGRELAGNSSPGQSPEQESRCWVTSKTGGSMAAGFNWDIKLFNAVGDHIHATALLDTQCHVGNWISKRLAERLGSSAQGSSGVVLPEVVDVSGQRIRACGAVDLSWRWHPQGTRIYECTFYVLPDSEHIDVIFGVEYIVAMNLVQANVRTIAPLVEHKKLSKADKAAIALAKERQRQEKAALAERRKQLAQKKGHEGGQQGDQQGGQQGQRAGQ